MEHKCIVCGKPLGSGDVCHGSIKGMEVTVCKEHMEQCDNCDTKYCTHRSA